MNSPAKERAIPPPLCLQDFFFKNFLKRKFSEIMEICGNENVKIFREITGVKNTEIL
jgi:hypothetical protein